MEFYQKITEGAGAFLKEGGYLMFELGLGQSRDVAEIMNANGFKDIKVLKDLANIDRVIWGHI